MFLPYVTIFLQMVDACLILVAVLFHTIDIYHSNLHPLVYLKNATHVLLIFINFVGNIGIQGNIQAKSKKGIEPNLPGIW